MIYNAAASFLKVGLSINILKTVKYRQVRLYPGLRAVSISSPKVLTEIVEIFKRLFTGDEFHVISRISAVV